MKQAPCLTDVTIERSTQSCAQCGGAAQTFRVGMTRGRSERESTEQRHTQNIGKSHEEFLLAAGESAAF
jgi:hypothetical protein